MACERRCGESGRRESNPHRKDGNLACSLYTTPAGRTRSVMTPRGTDWSLAVLVTALVVTGLLSGAPRRPRPPGLALGQVDRPDRGARRARPGGVPRDPDVVAVSASTTDGSATLSQAVGGLVQRFRMAVSKTAGRGSIPWSPAPTQDEGRPAGGPRPFPGSGLIAPGGAAASWRPARAAAPGGRRGRAGAGCPCGASVSGGFAYALLQDEVTGCSGASARTQRCGNRDERGRPGGTPKRSRRACRKRLPRRSSR